MDVSSIPGIAGPTQQTAKKSELGQDDFLKLMTTQFQNQDPFKPMENGDFLAQMAQFSTVSGISDLNQNFADLTDALGGEQGLRAASLIDRDVMVESNALRTSEAGQTVSLGIDSAPGDVVIDITDAGGQLVSSFTATAADNGINRVAWNGRLSNGEAAPAGQYQFSARQRVGDNTTDVPTLVAGRVDGVSLGGSQGTQLNIAGMGTIAIAQVRELY